MTQRTDRGFPDGSGQLYEENLGLVYHLVKQYLMTNPAADYESLEYVAMGAYINAIRLYESGGPARFSTYAYTSIRNAILRELDHAYRRRAVIAREVSQSRHEYTGVRRPTEEIALNHIFWDLFRNVGLTPREGEVMILHVLHDMTFEEIAEIHGNSRQANFNALSRAKEKLANNAFVVGYAEEA